MSKATTKFAIAFAFKELLLEKSIDKITINDITEKCGINRQTFYYHFHDIYELIEWICETDADHVLKQNKTYDTWQEGFLAIFHLLKKDEPFVVNIYHNAPRGYIYRYLYKVTYQLIYDVLEEKAAGMGYAAKQGKDISGNNQTERTGGVFGMGEEILCGGLADGDASGTVIRNYALQIHVGE